MTPRAFRSDDARPKGRHEFRRAKPGMETATFGVSQTYRGQRLDLYLQQRFPGFSRTFLQNLVKEGAVLVDGRPVKPHAPVAPGDRITVTFPEGAPRLPENLDLEIVYRDGHVLALNKRPGLVVHPARGHSTGTVLQGLFHLFREELARDPTFSVGPAHRLDRYTSGLLLCAWGPETMKFVQSQFEHREVKKSYLAIVHGEPPWSEMELDAPIGRDPVERKRQKVDGEGARPAATAFAVLGRGAGFALVRADPFTGRLHQIRAHLAHLGHPVAGDEAYGGSIVPGFKSGHQMTGRDLPGGDADAPDAPPLMGRTALHSWTLTFTHPATREPLTLAAPLWRDMREFALRFGLLPPGGLTA